MTFRRRDGPVWVKKAKFPLAKGKKLCYGVSINDRGCGREEPKGAGRLGTPGRQIRRIPPPGAAAGWGRGEHLRHCPREKFPVVALSAYDAIAVQSR